MALKPINSKVDMFSNYTYLKRASLKTADSLQIVGQNFGMMEKDSTTNSFESFHRKLKYLRESL